jgi:YidC/Oxa1 family membrane protein insertase
MDQRRMLLAALLSVGVLLLYNELVVRPRQPVTSQSAPGEELARPPAAAPEAPVRPPDAATPPVERAPAGQAAVPPGDGGYLSCEVGTSEPVVVETDLWRATLTPRGARLGSIALKKFRQVVDPKSPPLELVEAGTVLPLTVTLGEGASDAAVDYRPSTWSLNLTGSDSGEIVFSGATPSGVQLEKHVRFSGNSYLIDVDVRAAGQGRPARVGLVLPNLEREGIAPTSGSAVETAVALSQGKLIETKLDSAHLQDLKTEQHPDSRWVALSVPFFAGAIVTPVDPPNGTAVVERIGSKPAIRLEQAPGDGGAAFKVFMGPKSEEILAQVGYDLSRLVDFGWFWFIAIPMLHALRWLHRITGNYGVDIILLTVLVRAATIPLTQKSFRSMKEMQKIQPQLKRLQEQYKDDQTKLQKEMMELYKRHGVNPFSGCAPMILQIPIFVGLYNALLHAIELRHAPFALWITDLSSPERLMIGSVGIPVMTIIMGGTMLVQQWLTPQQGDPMQRQMMMIMPVFFTFMFFNFPSGLVLYWLVSNLLGIAQQYLMLRTSK